MLTPITNRYLPPEVWVNTSYRPTLLLFGGLGFGLRLGLRVPCRIFAELAKVHGQRSGGRHDEDPRSLTFWGLGGCTGRLMEGLGFRVLSVLPNASRVLDKRGALERGDGGTKRSTADASRTTQQTSKTYPNSNPYLHQKRCPWSAVDRRP